MKQIPITPQGMQRLQQKLEYLKNTERVEVIKAIAEARAHGDLSENAEYAAAKEKQSFIEGKIIEIENKLINIIVINPKDMQHLNYIAFGAKVEIIDINSKIKYSYIIVGEDESDIKQNKISINSPVGKGLVGKNINDIVNITLPSGNKEFEILNFTFNY